MSGAIKRRAGLAPFHEVAKAGPIPLGRAVLTSAGNLPLRGIIHVAGISGFWRASEYSIRHSVRNAIAVAESSGFESLAFPIIGAGSGGFNREKALAVMLDELQQVEGTIRINVVQYHSRSRA